MIARGDFVERTIVESQRKQSVGFQIQYGYIAAFALLIGCIQSPLAYICVFAYVSYFYMRDIKECKFAVCGIMIGSLSTGIFMTYFYALGFTVFFLCIHVLRILDKNIYKGTPYICALLTIPFSFYHYGLTWNSISISLFTFVLIYDQHRDFTWIQKKLVFTNAMYGVLFLSCALLISLFTPMEYHMLVFSGTFLLASFFCDAKIMLLLLGFLYIAYPNQMPSTIYLVSIAATTIFKKEKVLYVCILLGLGALLEVDLGMGIILSICAILGLIYDEQALPFHITKHETQELALSPQSLLKRQMQNFSSIFESLSAYYANVSDVEAQMLSQMAMALKYSADTIKKIDVQKSMEERILRALEGYQYEVLSFSMEEPGEGNLALDLDIRNIRKPEIKQTLLPLLEVLTHEHLKVTQIKHHRFTNGYHHITMENRVPYMIDAYADSQKNKFEASGDCFSIFRFRNSLICMISDGMGSGERAATSSRLITNIFQRMVISGIPKAESIKCINKLLQSDAYATLDVICFDCSEGKAYIFKSAACPTFLIRSGELFEINGSSLPVGIVSTIEPDCFIAEMKEGDEYLMVSDGIYMDEIYQWLNERKQDNAKNSIESFMQILRKKERMDDSTVVLSKVNKARN